MTDPHDHDRRPTRQQEARLDLILESAAWLAFLVFAWHAIAFLLRAFLG